MACVICGSEPGDSTRVEFLPSRKSMEVPMCEDCLREVAATKSINVARLDRR